jgi:hypothetical protein
MSDRPLYKLPTLVRREGRKLTGRLFLALLALVFLANLVYTELLVLRWHGHPLFGRPFLRLPSYPSLPALCLAALASLSLLAWLVSKPLRCVFRRSRPLIPTPSRPPIPTQGGHSVGAQRRPGLMVGRSGHLRHLRSSILSSSLFLQLTSSSRLCVAVGILGVEGGRPGFPRGVGRSGGGWVAARSFPYPGSFHSRGGGLFSGGRGGPAPRRAPSS